MNPARVATHPGSTHDKPTRSCLIVGAGYKSKELKCAADTAIHFTRAQNGKDLTLFVPMKLAQGLLRPVLRTNSLHVFA